MAQESEVNKELVINNQISKLSNKGHISDGYHTFDELYEHRITLFIALCNQIANQDLEDDQDRIWRSKLHSDGTSFDGWFILGINIEKGKQITYHLPMRKWKETEFATKLEKAPEFDGHSSEDVLKRLSKAL